MHLINPAGLSRRAFLRRSAQLAFTGAALPTALNLAAMGEAAAFGASDYKALVCVFLYGGNDQTNTVVPFDASSHAEYTRIRTAVSAGGIALPTSTLTRLNPTLPLAAGRQYALHPAMPGMTQLFEQGKAAVLLNVGPLVVPLTREQYSGSDRTRYPLPPKLFSHNDQQSVWQSSGAEGTTTGWGGRAGDRAMSNNTGSNALFTCMSVTGNTVFLSGSDALAYQVGTGGAVKIKSATDASVYGSSAVRSAMASIIRQSGGSHLMETAYTQVTSRAVDAEGAITTALDPSRVDATANTGHYEPFKDIPSSNPLAAQLKMVARVIAARQTLGNKRQVFFVSLGGFDLHDNLIAGHASLLERLSQAMTAFEQTMTHLNVGNSVTAFTASDFGRTLTSNGDGSDHGWGSHHFIVGGAVKGKAFYGKAPAISVSADDPDHVGNGRLLPSTSVDQYAATLAQWFGVTSGEMADVLPNLRNFTNANGFPPDLGFMQPVAGPVG